MKTEIAMLDIRSRQEWPAWLQKNHSASPGVWLIFHKNHTGIECVNYDDSVCEALCFGWIDSLIKRADDNRYARKFTPRKPESGWSAINRKRWAKLKAAGLLAGPGLLAAPTQKSSGPPVFPDLPSYLAAALKANPNAWNFFQQLALTYRRHYVAWIHSAARPETREKRIAESIAWLAAGKKLGLK